MLQYLGKKISCMITIKIGSRDLVYHHQMENTFSYIPSTSRSFCNDCKRLKTQGRSQDIRQERPDICVYSRLEIGHKDYSGLFNDDTWVYSRLEIGHKDYPGLFHDDIRIIP